MPAAANASNSTTRRREASIPNSYVKMRCAIGVPRVSEKGGFDSGKR